ncbi:MAG: PKD domain-containing protein [Thermoplasmata archaeon]|uniref:PKD domain-containing protein n=1 Tax=Candidatus Sysuiplasma superficiale TaxID=2823368 RepID=A0A8J7YNA9_9ARCH|nr:PKD domain-containing protein [Candidatus Sysuiplasma superficiale]
MTDGAGYTVNSNTIDETVNSDPTVSASASTTTADVGYSITFSSSPSGGTSPYTYSWTIGGTQVSTSQDFSYSFSSAGSYTVTVTVTDSLGETYSASVSVTINNNPAVSVSNNQNPTDVGNSVTFTASESGGTGTISYAWTVNGASEGSGSTLSYSFSSSGSYTIEVTVTDGDGHTASASLTETVYSDPSVSISSSQNPTDVGNSVTFTASPSGGSGSYTYQWYLNDNAVSGATSSTYTTSFSSSGTNSIYVIIKDGVGNSATSSTLDETVNADPSVSVSSSQNPTDVGNTVTFTATGSGGTGSYSYQWYLNGAAVSGATSSTYTTSFGSSGSDSVYVILTDGIGNTATSSTLTETVNADPTVSISSSQNPTDAGNSVTFTASASLGTSPFSYAWYVNSATQSSTSQSLDYTFSSPGTYYVNVTVKDSLGDSSSYSFSETVNVDPSVTISSSPAPTDVGVNVTFTATGSGGTGSYSYQWYLNGAAVSGATSSTYTTSFGSSGTDAIYVKLTDDAEYSVQSSTLEETVNADPVATISSEYSSVDQGVNDTFTANVNGGTYPFNYTWYVDNTIVNYSQSFHYKFLAPGNYTVNVTVRDNLSEKSTPSVNIIVIPRPSISIYGPTETDVSTPTLFIGNATYGAGDYNYYWNVTGNSSGPVGHGSSLVYSFPSSAFTYTITLTVIDKDGSKNTTTLNVTVNPLPTVAFNSSSLSGDIGLTDKFTSSIKGGTGPFEYSWEIGGNDVGSQPNLTYTFQSVGPINVRLTIIDTSGETGNSASYNTTISINPLPSVRIQAEYLSIDQGIADIFNANGSFGTGEYNYTWYVNSSLAGYGSSLDYSFSAPGSYLVKVVLNDSDGNQATAFVTISVFSSPKAVIATSSNSTDAGGSITFNGGYTGGTAPYNYTWYVDGGIASYSLSFSHTFESAGAHYVNFTVKDSLGESSTASVIIMVYANPTVSIAAKYSTIDQGRGDSFTPIISGGHGPYSYSWYISGFGIVSTQSILNFTFSNPGAYTITLTITDAYGNRANSTIPVIVNPPPSGEVSVQYPTVDENITDTISLTASNGTGPYTYAILINGVFVSSSDSYAQYFTVPGTYDITAYLNDSMGESVKLSSTIVVRANPTVTIVTPTNRTDANVSISFRGILSGGTGPYTYSWLIGGQTYNSSTLNHAFSAAGDYSIQLTVSDAFDREAIASVDETVYADPHASLVAPSYVRASVEEPLSLNISGGIAPYAIQWYFSRGEQVSGNNITHAFSSSGPDTIETKVTDSSGYTDTQNFTVNVHLFVAIAANQTSGLGPLAVQFSSSVLGGSDYAYNWSFGNGQHSLQQNPAYSFQPGNYSVTFKVTSANGATGEENTTITSLPPPVSFSYSPGTNGTILTTFSFHATPNWDASGPYSMSWSFPNGQDLTGLNVTYKFPVYSEFNTVIATFSYGNGQTWTQDISVRLYPAPIQASFSIPRIVPVGAVVNLTGSAVDPDSNSLTYTWVFQNQTFNGQDQFFVFSNAGNYSVSLTVTDSLGATTTYTQKVEAEPVGNNANIVIAVQSSSNGPYTTFTIHVLSSAPLAIVEAFLGTQSFTPQLTSVNNGYWYNITLDQSGYIPGTYPLKIVVFADNGESNYAYASFFVSQAYGHGGQQFSIVSFFGGTYTFLLTVLSIIVGIGTIVALRTDKKDKDTSYVNIGGAVVKAHKSPLARLGFNRAADRGDVSYLSSPAPPPPSFTPPKPPDTTGNQNWKFPPGGAS